MIKLQFPRGPMYGQGKFLYCAFIDSPNSGQDQLMFKFQSDLFYTGEINYDALRKEALDLAKKCFDVDEYESTIVCLELIGEIFE